MSKWIALKDYNANGIDYLLLAKVDKSGMVHFKTKRATPISHTSYNFGLILDIKEQWEKLRECGNE